MKARITITLDVENEGDAKAFVKEWATVEDALADFASMLAVQFMKTPLDGGRVLNFDAGGYQRTD